VGELAADVDAKGYEITNAVLVNSRLVGASLSDMHVHAASLVLPALPSAALLGTDATGRVGPATALEVQALNVTSGLALAPGAVLKLGTGAAAAEGGPAILTSGADGVVTATAMTDLLKGTTIDGATLANANVAASTKVAVASLASGGKGAVAVQGTDGHMQSSGVTATADGALLASSLGPLPSLLGTNTVAIAAAELTDAKIKGGTVAQAKSVNTDALEVTGKASIASAQFTGLASFTGAFETTAGAKVRPALCNTRHHLRYVSHLLTLLVSRRWRAWKCPKVCRWRARRRCTAACPWRSSRCAPARPSPCRPGRRRS
jgi:hypothetical protein